MTLVVVGPALVAAFCVVAVGIRQATAYVALPALLLLPAYYSHKLSGIPVINFHNYMFAVLIAGLFCVRERVDLVVHWEDIPLIFYCLWTVWSEYENKGFTEGRNLLAVRMMAALAPYYLAKVVARHNGWLCGLFLMIAFLGAFIGLAAPYEARLGMNPFDLLRRVWPGELPFSGALYRFGLRRVAGPFAHPIYQGFFFAMILPVVAWLVDRSLLRGKQRLIVVSGCLVGLLLAGSRGPWLGAIVGVVTTLLFWRKDRFQLAILGVLICLVGGMFLLPAFTTYVSISRGEAKTQSQETAAYRWEMLEHYTEAVAERPMTGYGKDQIPIIKGLKSIDNQYLFVALMHGMPASIAFLLAMLVTGLRGFIASVRRPHDSALPRLGVAVSASLLGAIVTQATVSAGTQTEQVLMFLMGTSLTLAHRLDGGSA